MMVGEAIARDSARVRLATYVGVPVYTLFAGFGLWAANGVWGRLVCDDVLAPLAMGGPMMAVGATSALAALVGIAGAAALFEKTFRRPPESWMRGALAGAAVGTAAALGPSALIVVGSQHTGPGMAVTLLALVLPSASTGAVGVLLLRPVSRSPELRRVFRAAGWLSGAVIAVWAFATFAPVERWTLLACA